MGLMKNSFGNIFTLTTFGESHGVAVGGVVDGMPAGVEIDEAFVQHELNRRRPGQSKLTTSRTEPDRVVCLKENQLVRLLVLLFITLINIRKTMIICATSSVRHMPISHSK